MKDYIDANAFREMILSASAALNAESNLINELNVFPVPDGDTGTNMSLTMKAAADEMAKHSYSEISAAADRAAGALLRGARGNSGVILSLLFRGVSRRFKGLETAGTKEFAGALNDGVDTAYKAVMKPSEGTILTVSRLASKAAAEAAELGADMEGVFICAIKAGNAALAETQSINPVLKKAGVVDAGGKGYMVILEAMLAALKGQAAVMAEAPSAPPVQDGAKNVFSTFSTESIRFAFDTVYTVHKDDPEVEIAPLRDYLASIGDCLVISEGDEEFKVHVHTNLPGVALTESAKYGTLELAKIENMRMQHDEVASGQKPSGADELDAADAAAAGEGASAAPEKKYGSVAVCAGAGLEELFRELGVDGIVSGGQTMNPSTDDILHAVNQTPASTVFVFPNNKNIIMAAQQCVGLSDKKVVVIPTKTVPQGITALMNLDPEGEEEDIVAAMTESFQNVHTAMVTYAARDSEFDGVDIHAGEYLALVDGALSGCYRSVEELMPGLSGAISAMEPQVITVYYGADVEENSAQAVAAAISAANPAADVSVLSGGQPVYYYMISVE